MADCNQFEGLRSFPAEVLSEVVREAETRVQAQLDTANAADQRALTIAGFQITLATASLGGGVALATGDSPDLWLGFMACIFAVVMAVCAREAIMSARPEKFDFPGNRPHGWLPENWLGGSVHGYTITQARIEQAACLDEAIEDNSKSMEAAGDRVRKSQDWSVWAVGIAALLLFSTLIYRNWTITEPTSEVVQITAGQHQGRLPPS